MNTLLEWYLFVLMDVIVTFGFALYICVIILLIPCVLLYAIFMLIKDKSDEGRALDAVGEAWDYHIRKQGK